jgi:hypothetical protein
MDRRVLAVDRQQRRATARHGANEQRTADDERFLVGEQQALARRLPPPGKAPGRPRRRSPP